MDIHVNSVVVVTDFPLTLGQTAENKHAITTILNDVGKGRRSGDTADAQRQQWIHMQQPQRARWASQWPDTWTWGTCSICRVNAICCWEHTHKLNTVSHCTSCWFLWKAYMTNKNVLTFEADWGQFSAFDLCYNAVEFTNVKSYQWSYCWRSMIFWLQEKSIGTNAIKPNYFMTTNSLPSHVLSHLLWLIHWSQIWAHRPIRI